MSVLDSVANGLLSLPMWAWGTGALLVAAIYWIFPFFRNENGLKRFPGPLTAKVSDLWMLIQARKHRISLTIDEQHQAHGDFVRIAPNHVSVAHPHSIRDVLGHGNGFLKSEFYYAFDNIEDNIFTTRDRLKHSRKRKIVSHMFSPKSMLGFEPYITKALAIYGSQMEAMIETGKAGRYVELGRVDERIKERQRKGEAALDAAKWSGFLAFDIIGDLAFGDPFGFTAAGFDNVGFITKLRDRGEWCATVGQMPWIKTWTPYFFFDPFFSTGSKAASALGRMGMAAVDKRRAIAGDPDRKDILFYLLSASDPEKGGMLPDNEIKAEALTQLIAGSDTTGNTITHVIDMMILYPQKLRKLQAELDSAFPSPLPENWVSSFAECKDLPYVSGVIHETLRLRTTVSVGLPRVVSKGGAKVCGEFFEAGTVLSTPTYTTHRDARVWGQNALEYEPERWTGNDRNELEKHFLGFSYGPRACIGRNVAFMELKKTVATLFRRFEYRRIFPDDGSEIREGFHFKVQELPVFIHRRT
ncbi:Cytochrome P450 53 [Hyphodiscus hymeniophilus]|uniref:Cytochrome P450 53 n=1 Tax=Hyphodiscus hymeniophilus TaxID=353542 RepID=A0A9P6VLD9_9HELO|nr:Cytochrome P450 53 [Hyphodiscus hymeniophilus]